MYNLKKGVSICIFYGDLLERYVDIGKKRKTTPLFSVPFALEGYDTIILHLYAKIAEFVFEKLSVKSKG